MRTVLFAYVLMIINIGQLNAMQRSAMMDVIKSNGFGDVKNVKFILSQNQSNKDTPFYMTLEYQDEIKILEVKSENISQEECGRITYLGNLFNGSEEYSFSAQLTDYSFCTGENPYGFKWHVKVRAGYRWCGTGDPIMEMVGNPK